MSLRNKKKRVNPEIEKINSLSDEEILKLEKQIYIKHGIISSIGFILFIMCVIMYFVLK